VPSLLVVASIWGAAVLLIWRDRNETLLASDELTQSLTRAAAEQMEAGLRGVDLMLQDAGQRMGETGRGNEAQRVERIRGRAAAFPEVRSIFLAGSDGEVRFTTEPPLSGTDLAYRTYFQAAKADFSPPRLTLTQPLLSPATGHYAVLAVRPLVGPLGSFQGVVVAALDPAFFRDVLAGMMSEAANRAVIANLDGDVLARFPEPEQYQAVSIKSGPLFSRQLPERPFGTITVLSPLDGREVRISYQKLEHYPVVVWVGTTIEAALRRWNFNAGVVCGAGLIFAALTLAAAALLDRREGQRRQVEQALMESEEHYRQLVEGQNDLIHRYAPDTSLQFFNKAYASFHGRAPEALRGMCWIELVPEAERPEILAALRVMKPGTPVREDLREVLRHDGQKRWIEWRTTAMFDPMGRVTAYQTIGRDVTHAHLAQQAISEREELYRQTFHRNPAIKLLIDPRDGAIMDANEAAARFYGYPAEALKRMRIEDISLDTSENIRHETAAVEHQERTFARSRHRLSSGETRDVEVYSSQVNVGGRGFLGSIVVDVTERNRFEAELAAKSAELERSNADLEQFAYVASHDLRQPLRMVSSYVSLLGRRLAGKLDSDESEFMGYAVDGVKRMDALILALLDYSRVGRGSEAAKSCDLAGMVAAAADNLGIGRDAGDVTLAVQTPLPTVTGVEGELVRLLQNLLGNALKYRAPERPLRIAVSVERDGDHWAIHVADNGIGIEPQHFDRIFKMFQRLHGDGEFEGTGIGLAICRKIVCSHGGRLWVDSVPGEGSRFSFSLPVEIDGAPNSGQPLIRGPQE